MIGLRTRVATLAGVIVATVVGIAAPAQAKEIVNGTVYCEMGTPAESLSRPLQDTPAKVKKSKVTITQSLPACVGPGLTRAPGGVVRGVLTAKGTLPTNVCNRGTSPLLGNFIHAETPVKAKITWFGLSGTQLGTSKVTARYRVLVVMPIPSLNLPGSTNVYLEGAVAAKSKYFPSRSFDLHWQGDGELVFLAKPPTQVSAECSGSGVSNFGLHPGFLLHLA